MLPRDAYFATTQDVPAAQATGRICAEQVTPYPPGIPVLLPGERIGGHVLDYLLSGVQAGMVIPMPPARNWTPSGSSHEHGFSAPSGVTRRAA